MAAGCRFFARRCLWRSLSHLLVGTAVALCWVVGASASELNANLRADIEQILVEENLVGISWALVDTTGVETGAAGLRDKPAGVAFTQDTRFHVGSVTKAVLATGMLRLATQGRLDLDAPIVEYMPEFAGEISAEFETVTSRQLLDHTAGLNDAYLWQMFSESASPDAPLISAFPQPQKQLSLRTAPGTQFSYSNMGYTLAGMVIESVVGGRYEDYLDKNVLAPLGMHQSTFAYTSQKGDGADSSLAWGHVDDGSVYAAQPVFLRPAAQMTTSANDLGLFAAFLMSDGRIAGESFIKPSLMRARGKVIGTHAATQGLRAGYALGLGRRDRHGVVGYCHGGNILGFKAMLCIFPEEQRAFVYSVNTDSESADYGRLDALFIKALQIGSVESNADLATRVSPAAPDLNQWGGWYVYSPNRFDSFRYLDVLFGAIHVKPSAAVLTLRYLQRGDRILSPTADHRFIASDRHTESHVFYHAKSGAAFFSDGFQTYQRVNGSFIAVRWLSFFLGVLGLLWILLFGGVELVKQRRRFFAAPIAPAFVASVLLFLPLSLFFTQSFMALGDVTPASAFLALVTGLWPLGLLMTLWRCLIQGKRINWMHSGIAAVSVLQWCVVLASYSLLPLRLWA